MLKKIITGTIVLLVITVRLSAEASAPGISVGVGFSIVASKPRVQQKGLKKKTAARHQSRPAHQKPDRHLAKVVKRVIRHKGLSVRPATAGLPTVDETPDRHLSADFQKHKGQLARPLSGTVSMSFGPHEYMGRLQHNNVGITVDAPEGTVVKAVYQGEVTAIEEIGDVWCVIMRHGKYYSAYSNLASTTVVKGQHIPVGETLGRIGDTGQLEFLLMNDNGEYVDPEKWLRK
jgi:murein DD-endopeptidase MepM/ murein hydrolase activator NlpD